MLLGGALLVLPFAPAALALDPKKAISQYVHDVWTGEQGLPDVGAICQTRDGYLWIGTGGGLVRHDGVRFTVFDKRNTPELPGNDITALHEARGGTLWIGTLDGLARYEGGRFTSFATQAVLSIREDREGSLWIGTSGGLLKRSRDGGITPFTTRDGLLNDVVTSIEEDSGGTVWVGTRGGLQRFENGKLGSFTTVDGLSDARVTSVRADREGTLWIGTKGGLNRMRDGTLTALTTNDGLSSADVSRVFEDRDGSLWIGTLDGGLNRMARAKREPRSLAGAEGPRSTRLVNGEVVTFTTKGGLSGVTVRAICEDREGSLWIGTAEGLDRFRDGKFTPNEVSDVSSSIYEGREGSVWIGTLGGGVKRLEDGKVTTYTTREGLFNDVVWAVYGDRGGSLWIGTRGGLNRLRDGVFDTFRTKDGLSDDDVLSLYEDREGSLWLGTSAGLNRYRGGTFTSFTTKDGMSNDEVVSICEDREGSLWIGTRGGGLNRMRFRDGKFTSLTTRDGLSSDQVFALYEDMDGSLWIGTNGGGLNRYKGGRFTSITTKDGLFDDVVSAILEDDHGNLWMSSDHGIMRARKKDLDAFADGRLRSISCVSYGTADGMRNVECARGLQPAAWKARDGRLWFPTAKGLVVIVPARIPVNALPPPVYVEEVLVDRKLLPRATPGRVVLPPGIQKLELHYTALSFVAPSRVKFRYRLEGFDKDWVDAGTERTAHYTSLPPRSYTFKVIACNDDGLWNETGASFAFTLRPHFYQTWWFYALCALGVAAGAAATQQVRLRRMRARERELVRLVDERTDELRGANQKLLGAQEKISRLLASSPGASESVPEWSRGVAEEIAGSIGAVAIGIWEVDRDSVTALSDAGVPPPSRETLEGLRSGTGLTFVDSGEGTIVPVTGSSGELCGALVVRGNGIPWGDTERRLVESFAHQLGGALAMSRMRRQLAAAEERRAATRQEMHARGIATLQICPICGRCYDHTAATCGADGSTLESPRPLPHVLLGRYRFVAVLGKGGMGLILSAHDEKLDREVAVKLIRPDHWSNSDLRQRFEREARAVAHIQHPGVVSLYDSGELDDGTAFLVMEKLSGCDLALLLKTHGRGKPAQVASLIRQGCSALHAAHRSGVVHRDVKPENVFLVDEPAGFRVKLLDFGLAKSLKLESGLTQTGMILGTPVYMAPEQVQGEDVDTRADVYSFAAVAYEALTGRQAIQGNDLGRVLMHVLNTPPPPVSSLVPEVPPEVDAAFASALAKDPSRRLKDIELWSSSFVELLERTPATAAGWPESRDVLTRLRDSRMERAVTHQLPGGPKPGH